MADKWPLANGSYSTAANWNGGTLPVDGDIIYLDGRTITLDVDIDLPNSDLRSTQRSGGTTGGALVWSLVVVRSIRFREVLAGGSIPVAVSGSGGLSVGAGTVFQGSNTGNFRALQHGGAGNLTFGAGCQAKNGTGGTSAQGVAVVAVCSISGTLDAIASATGIAEAVIFTAAASFDITGAIQHGFVGTTISFNTAIGTWTITEETCVGATTSSGSKFTTGSASLVLDRQLPEVFEFPSTWTPTHIQANSISGQNCEYRGNITQPNAAANQLFNTSANGTLRHRGTLYGPSALNMSSMVYGSTAGSKVVIDKIAPHPVSGLMPNLGPNWRARSDSELVVSTESATVTLVPSTEVGDPPAVTDVRDGVTYHFGTLEGTAAIPGASSVAVGVPVDATVGTAVLTLAQATSANPYNLVSTTIATLASQTVFTLTSGSADDDAYLNQIAIITDQATSVQKAVVKVLGYVGATRTVTLSASPVFTIAVGDAIVIAAHTGTPSVTVAPLSASGIIRVNGTTIQTFVGEVVEIGPVAVVDVDGDEVDLSGMLLEFSIQTQRGIIVAVVDDADITVSGAGSNQFSFMGTAAMTVASTEIWMWSLRDLSDGDRVVAHGSWAVLQASLAE